MVTDVLGVILGELGALLNIPDLKPDEYHTCLIKLASGTTLQIEQSKDGQTLLIGSELGVVPPGRYRIDLFKEAMKANAQPLPRYGTFGWSKKTDNLVFFRRIPLKELTGEKLHAMIPPFVEIVKKWKEAIDHGDIPLNNSFYTSGGKGGLFGLIR